jgi:hypothetical protein
MIFRMVIHWQYLGTLQECRLHVFNLRVRYTQSYHFPSIRNRNNEYGIEKCHSEFQRFAWIKNCRPGLVPTLSLATGKPAKRVIAVLILSLLSGDNRRYKEKTNRSHTRRSDCCVSMSWTKNLAWEIAAHGIVSSLLHVTMHSLVHPLNSVARKKTIFLIRLCFTPDHLA